MRFRNFGIEGIVWYIPEAGEEILKREVAQR